MAKGHCDRNEWLEDVFRQYSGPLLRYALGLIRNEDQARDATQETFLRLIYARQDKVRARVGPWLFTVLRNIVFDKRKKGKRMVTQFNTADSKDMSAVAPLKALEIKQSATLFLQLFETLSERQQEVIRLRFQNGFSYREISEISGLTVSNVGFLMHTGLKKLRREYSEQQRDDSVKAGIR